MSGDLNRVVRRAMDSYSMWHQKHPNEVLDITIAWPEEVYQCGRAEQILYRSDKWEDDNNFFMYDHVFDTRPFVYCQRGSVLEPFANSKRRSVRRLLRVNDLEKDPVPLPYLAKAVELTISLSDGTGQTLNLVAEPALCCTLDLKTLVICMENDILFINGGKMHVTERGIVK